MLNLLENLLNNWGKKTEDLYKSYTLVNNTFKTIQKKVLCKKLSEVL